MWKKWASLGDKTQVEVNPLKGVKQESAGAFFFFFLDKEDLPLNP